MDAIEMPIEDVLDLHTFSPKEVEDLLETYLAECAKEGIYSVRVIHGKGQGVLKRRVEALLRKNPLVGSISAAPGGAGGWGATLVELKRRP
jgi:DNA-nicking Smr family endonuclease